MDNVRRVEYDNRDKAGTWEPLEDSEEEYWGETGICSACGHDFLVMPYCPYCGAKMDNAWEGYYLHLEDNNG